ncbi:hypothetical protein NFI96_009853, partial [Prochilodus magdalenae]
TVVPALFRSLTRSCRVILGSFLTFLKIIDAPRGIHSLSKPEGRSVSLACGNEGKVVWSKGADRGTSAILTAEDGVITQKHRADPGNRYRVLADLSLVIVNLSLSDSGTYYCNNDPVVYLTVYPAPPAAQCLCNTQGFHGSIPVCRGESGSGLLRIRQGRRSVADYAIEFRTLAAESNWNLAALMEAYHQGLSEELEDELAPRDPPSSLENLIELSLRLDNRLRERHHSQRSKGGPLTLPTSTHLSNWVEE